ncbi:MAG: hypothetical protein PHW31_04220 [Candidatus Pacebacteria bacterium]|nr:hypothetical protein [Candidatus Paceibacterota bacterium]
MEQQFNNQFNSQPVPPQPSQKGIRPFWLVAVIILTAIIAGGGVYLWQSRVVNNLTLDFQQRIIDLSGKFIQLSSKQNKVGAEESLADKSFKYDTQVYRNETYGFEIHYPKQTWSLKDTLPKVKKDIIADEKVEFYTDPFGEILADFILYPNPLGFGAEFCTTKYSLLSNDGIHITSIIKGEDECDSDYLKTHNVTNDECSSAIRSLCFGTPTMSNDNFYWGYLNFKSSGDHSYSTTDAESILKAMLASFEAF